MRARRAFFRARTKLSRKSRFQPRRALDECPTRDIIPASQLGTRLRPEPTVPADHEPAAELAALRGTGYCLSFAGTYPVNAASVGYDLSKLKTTPMDEPVEGSREGSPQLEIHFELASTQRSPSAFG